MDHLSSLGGVLMKHDGPFCLDAEEANTLQDSNSDSIIFK